jgi:hypothetical protein
MTEEMREAKVLEDGEFTRHAATRRRWQTAVRRCLRSGTGHTFRFRAAALFAVLAVSIFIYACRDSGWQLTLWYAGGEGYLRENIGILRDFPRESAYLKERQSDAAQTNAVALHGGNFVPLGLVLAKQSIALFRKAQEIAPWSVCGSGTGELADAYLQSLWLQTGCVALGGDLKPGKLLVGTLVTTKSGRRVAFVQWSARLTPKSTLDDASRGRAGRALSELRTKTDAQILLVGIATRDEILRFVSAYRGADLVIVRDPLSPGAREAGVLQTIGGTSVYFSGGPTQGVVEFQLKMNHKTAQEVTASEPPRTKDPDPALIARLAEAVKEWTTAYTAGEFEGFKATELKYSGALSCRVCHQAIHDSYMASRHAKALNTLVRTRDEYDPECLACHSTGFRKGGFRNARDTPAFGGVQCEACHGSAMAHLRNPKMRAARPTPQTCLACHTEQWSPGFNALSVWVTGTHIRADPR